MVTVTNDAYITSAQVLMLIDRLIDEFPGQSVKLVMDNAKYQRCKLVMEYAASHEVESIFYRHIRPI
jgi:hypothetical protein